MIRFSELQVGQFLQPKLGMQPQGLQMNSGEIIFQVDISIEIALIETKALTHCLH